MKASNLIQILRVSPPDKWIRFYDDAHREILDFFKCITDGVISYSLRYGMVRIEDVISIEPFGVEQDCVELISEGRQYAILELYDLRYVGYDDDEVEFEISKRGAGREEYEKSEKDAMWEGD